LELSNSIVGDVNHRPEKYGCGVSKSKPACKSLDFDNQASEKSQHKSCARYHVVLSQQAATKCEASGHAFKIWDLMPDLKEKARDLSVHSG
jgi:hypothetical protein